MKGTETFEMWSCNEDEEDEEEVPPPALCTAAAEWLAEEVHQLLDQGANVNVLSRVGNTLCAVGRGRSFQRNAADDSLHAVVKILVDKGADVNVKARAANMQTPLHISAERGFDVVVQMLVDNGAGVNVKDQQGGAPLHLAAFTGHARVVHLLLDKGAAEREFFISNLLVRIHLIIKMILVDRPCAMAV